MIKKFELTDSFFVGHKQIDAEHGKLIILFNEIVDAFNVSDLDLCSSKWFILVDEFEKHLDNEQVIMKQAGFSGEEHEEYRIKFMKELNDICSRCKNDFDWETCILDMLDKFLKALLKQDMKFSSYLKSTI